MKKMTQRLIKNLSEVGNVFIENQAPFSRNPKFVIMCHHSFSLQTWSQQYKWTTCVLEEDLYPKNSKMRFLWHRDDGKIDCISQLL